ncbi:alpha/beta hydrolase family protein [Nocardia sp. NPDC050406]|uniref:alpha/beta hydrolase family protein n=1 Tax=Nocardia sp. NPDC050406 TaxID=3364318 RepID=UPI003792AE70
MSGIESDFVMHSPPAPRRRWRTAIRLSIASAALCLAAAVNAPIGAAHGVEYIAASADSTDFYQAPADQLAGPHGSIIHMRAIDGDPGIPGARNYMVLYRSVDMRGETVAVSGTVAVPPGPPPPGGWPLISWAHGTTGVADICAPSRDDSEAYPAHDYTSLVRSVQAQWVRAGYAVAQTDYQGLGTPGPHGYLIGTAEQRAVTDMALAARQIEPEIGTRWVAMGHSQGGQAAIFTDAQAAAWAPELQLLGAVALAPASHQAVGVRASQFASSVGAARALSPLTGGSISFLPLVIRGAQTVADVEPADFLTARANAMLPLADSGCIAQLRGSDEWGGLAADEVFSPTGDIAAFTGVLAENDPSALTFGQPLLVLQGRADTTVPAVSTDTMVAQHRLAGLPVDYRTYAGTDHRGVLEASYPDALTWVNERFAAH